MEVFVILVKLRFVDILLKTLTFPFLGNATFFRLNKNNCRIIKNNSYFLDESRYPDKLNKTKLIIKKVI